MFQAHVTFSKVYNMGGGWKGWAWTLGFFTLAVGQPGFPMVAPWSRAPVSFEYQNLKALDGILQ